MAKAIFILDPVEVLGVKEKLAGIKRVDSSFRYDIVEARNGSGYLLIVFAKDKSEAHKKSLWIWDKVFGKDRAYFVKE